MTGSKNSLRATYIPLRNGGPLEKLWGGGDEVQKKSCKGKLSEKKSCTASSLQGKC